MIWRNFLQVTVNFSFFHTHCEFSLTEKIFREIDSWVTSLFSNVRMLLYFDEIFVKKLFSKKFRESNVLLKYFTLNWFDEKILFGNEFLVFPHYSVLRTMTLKVCKYLNFTLAHSLIATLFNLEAIEVNACVD